MKRRSARRRSATSWRIWRTAATCISRIHRRAGCPRRRPIVFLRRRSPRRQRSVWKTAPGFGANSPPLSKTVLEHARLWLLPDGRVVVVLISPGGATRDKVLRPPRTFTQQELDATAEFLNRQYSGWTLEAIRTDLLTKLATERERYEGLLR